MRGGLNWLGMAGVLVVAASVAAAQTADKARPRRLPRRAPHASPAQRPQTPTGQPYHIGSKPRQSKPEGAKHDRVFFFATHRPGDNVRNEVNTIIGYAFKKEST